MPNVQREQVVKKVFMMILWPLFIAVFDLVCQKYQVELRHKLVVCKPTSTRLVKLGQKAEMVNFAKSCC